ncbi:rod shape-determining protein MreD [Pantoea sp. SoEX]|nr:rod shape-determining protein MreD [Pantoea sp. SoEX]
MPWPSNYILLRPSWFLLLLIYWLLALPYSINVISGFLLGILMDIISGSKLGIGAITFSIIAFFITSKFQVIRNLNLFQQILMVIFISLFMNLAIFFIEFFIIGASFRNKIFLNSIVNGIIWPVFFLFLSKKYK